MVIAQELVKIRLSSVIGERKTLGTKVHIFRRLGIQQQQSIVEIFLHIYIELRKSFPLKYQ